MAGDALTASFNFTPQAPRLDSMGKAKKSREVRIWAKLPRDLVEQLEAIAKEERKSRAMIIGQALDDYVRAWKLRKTLERYRRGELTLAEAADRLGMSIYALLAMLDEEEVDLLEEVEEAQLAYA